MMIQDSDSHRLQEPEELVVSVPEFVKRIAETAWQDEWLFRGHANAAWELRPSLARIRPRDANTEGAEHKLFAEFKRMASPHVSRAGLSDWEWLALAQHHGLPTRLLDWTTNPLAAAFFAVEQPCDTDSAVWCYRFDPGGFADERTIPFGQSFVRVLRPTHVSPRITGQFGYFTVHPPPYEDLRLVKPSAEGTLFGIMIPRDVRYVIRTELDRLGVNRASLFPDLDGIAKYVRWTNEVLKDEPESWTE